MIFKNKICTIEIARDNTCNINTINKGNYDIVYNLDEYNQDEYYAIISVKVNLYYDNFKIALIGGAVDTNNNISILEENMLIVLQNDMIIKINVLDGSIILHKHLYSYGENFEIYKIKNGYIIYGEGEITMLDKKFEVKWTFSGSDIFVSDSKERHFLYAKIIQLNYMIGKIISIESILMENFLTKSKYKKDKNYGLQ